MTCKTIMIFGSYAHNYTACDIEQKTACSVDLHRSDKKERMTCYIQKNAKESELDQLCGFDGHLVTVHSTSELFHGFTMQWITAATLTATWHQTLWLIESSSGNYIVIDELFCPQTSSSKARERVWRHWEYLTAAIYSRITRLVK